MNEPVQLEFDFVKNLPKSVPGPQPVSDPIQVAAEVVTVFEVLGRRYRAERQAARQRFGLAA